MAHVVAVGGEDAAGGELRKDAVSEGDAFAAIGEDGGDLAPARAVGGEVDILQRQRDQRWSEARRRGGYAGSLPAACDHSSRWQAAAITQHGRERTEGKGSAPCRRR